MVAAGETGFDYNARVIAGHERTISPARNMYRVQWLPHFATVEFLGHGLEAVGRVRLRARELFGANGRFGIFMSTNQSCGPHSMVCTFTLLRDSGRGREAFYCVRDDGPTGLCLLNKITPRCCVDLSAKIITCTRSRELATHPATKVQEAFANTVMYMSSIDAAITATAAPPPPVRLAFLYFEDPALAGSLQQKGNRAFLASEVKRILGPSATARGTVVVVCSLGDCVADCGLAFNHDNLVASGNVVFVGSAATDAAAASLYRAIGAFEFFQPHYSYK